MLLEILTLFWGMCAYLVGALPSGYLIANLAGINDITQHGSGTIGATNVGRHLGISYFFLIFFIDAGKAAAIMYVLPAHARPLGIIMLMIGNTHSSFLAFGGGKGVATLIGILCVLDYTLALFFVVVWLCALLALRRVGGASSIALISLVFGVFFLTTDSILACRIAFAALWSLYIHKEHVKKLLYSSTQGLRNEIR